MQQEHNHHEHAQSNGTAVPMVSVVMPTYKHERYIAKALEGVLSQETSFQYEVIVADDCSPDSTLHIALDHLNKYRHKCIRVLSTEENMGMQKNVFRALSAARGRYIAFCEGDDVWTCTNKLELQARFLRNHPDHGAIHSDFDCLYPRGSGWAVEKSFQKNYREPLPTGDIYAHLLNGMFVQTCTLMCRTDTVLEYYNSGHPYEQYLVADWPLCLFIAKRYKVGYIDDSLAAYRRAPGSATNSGKQADLDRSLNAITMIEEFCRRDGVDSSIRHEAISKAYQAALSIAFDAADAHHFNKAWDWLSAHEPDFVRRLYQKLKRRMMNQPGLVRPAVSLAFAVKMAMARQRQKRVTDQ